MRESVKVLNGALDFWKDDQNTIILRGSIDPDSLPLLKVDEYQREVLPLSTIQEIMQGLQTGSVPDIVLGMRG